MNINVKHLLSRFNSIFNWWVSGWQDAWDALPKTAFLHKSPIVFLCDNGARILAPDKVHNDWCASNSDDKPNARLLVEDQVLLRQLVLPQLSESDIAAAVAIEARQTSPFPSNETFYTYSIRRLPAKKLGIEIAITTQNTIQAAQNKSPHLPLYAQGEKVAIPLFIQATKDSKLLTPLNKLLVGFLVVLIAAWAISPTLLLREKAKAHEAVFAEIVGKTIDIQRQREQSNELQQQMESIRMFNDEHPDVLQLLESLSAQLPDGTWLRLFSLQKKQLTLQGTSNNAISIVSLLEKEPYLTNIRLEGNITRDPRTGGEGFQIQARVETPQRQISE